ncbi:ectoine/hydroxyectoine ABC transporter permease subunit EhuC [Pusillimonas sp. CC-YST705]|uniref:Ectoine/hydroxyectoine ABC transporter permease subunit EhuC n=1 Tax=Mesopusillimonas faecipullorum TaxID=2755040 RepID=A0ABS8CA10_9BURK|nr:ectoine/hydroxyectoine ABC transporter permease subunit EhuC [Mesopusillimonas faecipullorum]MCB5362868.1 ectoine/hydroxyectoine ABC transporter permease subunit EhuC [Mesopusillimonas faecipullorum]
MNWVSYLPPLLEGAAVTAQLAIYSTVLGAMLAFALGLGRFHGMPYVRGLCLCIVEFFRGTSLLVQLFWLFFALPIVGESLGWDWRLSPMVAGTLALSLNIGAYGAEVVRGALQAVPVGQLEAGLSLGLSPRRVLWKVRLPQALPEMMPSLGNLAVQNLKDTALVSLISLGDMAFRAEQIRNLTQDSTSVYTLLLLLYFGMALVVAGSMKTLEWRLSRWRTQQGR